MIKVRFDTICIKYRKLGFLITNEQTNEQFYLEDYPDFPKVSDEEYLRNGNRLAEMLERFANELLQIA